MLGSLIGFVGDAFNAITGQSSEKKQREFEEKMYYQQRDDALAQWNRENAYNDPSAQMSRLKNAGINPDMAFSGGQVQNLGSHSSIPQAGSYQRYQPNFDFASNLQLSQQLENMKAEEEKTRAETESIKESTKSTMTFNQFYEQLLQGQVNLTDVEIKSTEQFTKSDAEKLYPTIQKLVAETESLNSSVRQIESNIRLTDAKTLAQQIDNVWKNPMYSAQIKNLSSNTNLSEARCKDLLESLFYRVGILKGEYVRQGTLSQREEALLDNIILQNGRLKIEVNNAQDVHELNALSSLVGVASSILGGVNSVKP